MTHRTTNISTFRLRRRTPGSFLLVPCPHQGRSIRCQGQLEAAAAVILVACPQVAHLQEQPLAIWYAWHEAAGSLTIQLLDGPPASRRSQNKQAGTSYIVPDFLVDMSCGRRRLMEIKSSDRLARPIVQRKLAVGRAFAAQQGWSFHVVTEENLLAGPLLSNLRLINRYRQARLDTEFLQELVHQVSVQGIALSSLFSGHDSNHLATLRIHIFHLLATGQLSFDPRSRPLDDQTLVFPGGAVSWDPFDSLWASNGSSTGGSGA